MPLPTAAEMRDRTKTNAQMREMMAQMAENVESKQDTTLKANEVVLNSIFANLARISSNPSLVDFAQVITSRQTDGWTRIQWLKGTDVLNTKGIFVAFKLEVVGAAYPTSHNDANVFGGSGMRVQAFDSVGLKYTRNLINLPGTKIWYYFGSDTDTALNVNDVAQIKVEFYAKTGVTLIVSEPILYPDNKLPNAEPLARQAAINNNELKLFEDRLLSNMQTDEQNNLLTNVAITNPNAVSLESPILSTTHSKYSVACIIDTDGTYPTDNSSLLGFRARFETVNGSTASNSTFLKRIGNSKVWYAKDVKVSGTFSKVKIYAQKVDGTYIKIDKAIISPNSFPDNYYLNVNAKIPSELNDLDSIVTRIVAQEMSELNIESYPTTAFDALSRAETRRVDVVGFGDSNHYMDGYGFDYALRNALTNRFGLYATPPLSGANNSSFLTTTIGASSEQAKHILASLNYIYVPDGTVISSHTLNGLIVGGGSTTKYRLNPVSKLRCHFAYSTFSSGAGSFKPGVRTEQSPWSVRKMADLINTNTGSESKVLTYFDLDVDAARVENPLGFKWTVPQQTDITGPFLSYFMRIEDLNKNNGICFSSLYGAGGQSLWDMVAKMNEYSMQHLSNYFNEIRRLQLSKNQSPLVVIYINSGLNDQNETSSPSWGWRESTDGKSATAYLDNLEALAKRISDVWQFNGWDERELFFLIVPSHPTATPDAEKLKAYRKAAFTFAGSRARVSVVDFENLTSESELTANDWYREPTDHSHLKLAGYEALSQRIVDLVP
ncbi:hypothetical protein [Acinetobacter soli]|uniref:hypothetical protein n=1 Tax=Acinetobacter soli TaxID=487316 RepID=UPI0012509FA2|nr:hypothetical protein [Acinetobacter soli]